MPLILARIGQSKTHWALMIGLGVALEATALFYEHALNRLPCALCIHARLWVLALILVGVLGLTAYKRRIGRITAGILGLGGSIGLLERSWQLLGTQRSWLIGSCKNHAGLPEWFALDEWFPVVLGVKGACGQTPELLFGVTMAEGLMAISLIALIFTGLVTYSGLGH